MKRFWMISIVLLILGVVGYPGCTKPQEDQERVPSAFQEGDAALGSDITVKETSLTSVEEALRSGLDHRKNGELDLAVQAFSKAIELDPENEEFPARLRVLFDRPIERFLPADAIWALVNRVARAVVDGTAIGP